jgi:hypothetical protein
MKLNDHVLDIRRRTHNGKDLPAEITSFIVRGTNVLVVAVHDAPGEQSSNRHLAVELLETQNHSTVIDSIWARGVVPEEKTLETIKNRLTSTADDEVSFDVPDLSIDLADPFSSTIFTIPTRGASCTHMECFDLENWLNTRPTKSAIKCAHKQVKCKCDEANQPSNPDKWRCPICFKDARPYSLKIDGFLLGVRKKLAEEGKLATKSMRVKADGEWSVVVEEEGDDGSDGEGEARGGGGATGRASAQAPIPIVARREIEVIELD